MKLTICIYKKKNKLESGEKKNRRTTEDMMKFAIPIGRENEREKISESVLRLLFFREDYS